MIRVRRRCGLGQMTLTTCSDIGCEYSYQCTYWCAYVYRGGTAKRLVTIENLG